MCTCAVCTCGDGAVAPAVNDWAAVALVSNDWAVVVSNDCVTGVLAAECAPGESKASAPGE